MKCEECGHIVTEKVYTRNGAFLGKIIHKDACYWLEPVGDMTEYMLKEAYRILKRKNKR